MVMRLIGGDDDGDGVGDDEDDKVVLLRLYGTSWLMDGCGCSGSDDVVLKFFFS